ncbi:phosphoribosylamine--glycine ligase [Streptosporangiaceae bacterium NEAU-GS5]|nr:phosphoribosylamine--glycine ligase [Streptosporangiaceae bacterium NEAU-GS5]
MRVLVIGSGGREHALCRALSLDPAVSGLHCAPGNPGIAELAAVHDVNPLSGAEVVDLAVQLGVELVVVGPEAPLVAGVADCVRAADIPCFGPSSGAARIEGSKAFAKEVMVAAGVPTARAFTCDSPNEVLAALSEFGAPYVVKDDGLAAGKGVVVTSSREEAMSHAAGCVRVVVEEYLDGPEVSVFAVCDGETAMALQAAQDFKRAYDDDGGPNTGGMGAYTPLPWAPDGLVERVMTEIVRPTVAELAKRGTPYVGVLYAGLALTPRGPGVIEFNARLGDPEAQVILDRLETPLAGLLMAAATGRLAEQEPPRFRDGAAVAVVVASEGYPAAPVSGDPIVIGDLPDGSYVLHAGTAVKDGRLVTNGGRVLNVVGTGKDVAEARRVAYEAVGQITLRGAHHRSDIALRAAQA